MLSEFLPHLSSRGGLKYGIIQRLPERSPARALCIISQLNAHFRVHHPSKDLMPWGLALQRIALLCQREMSPGEPPLEYQLVAPLLYDLGKGAFSDFMRTAIKLLAITQASKALPLQRGSIGHLLMHLTDHEAHSLLYETDFPASRLLLEVITYLQECIARENQQGFSAAELEWILYWEGTEVAKFPSLQEPLVIALEEDGEVKNPFLYAGWDVSFQDANAVKLLELFVARHLKINSFDVDGKCCATIEGVSSIVSAVINRLAQGATDMIWLLSAFRILSNHEEWRSKVSQSLAMALRKALVGLIPQMATSILFLSWMHHAGASSDDFSGVHYGAWLKQSLHPLSSRFSANPQQLETLALSFKALVVEAPLHLMAVTHLT